MPDPNRLITQLDLSVHTYYRLFKADLLTVGKIAELVPEELLPVLRERRYIDELRAALLAAGYKDPWPELDDPADIVLSPSIDTLGLRADIHEVLAWAGKRTLARVLGTPPDDMLDFLTWNQFDALRRRLTELGHLEPGNIDR
jgi:hypothetical protein